MSSSNSSAAADVAKKFAVKIFQPQQKPKGITVFMPGTLLRLEDYKSTYELLVEQGHIVIGFTKMNPFPVIGRSHQKMAEDVAQVVQEFRALDGNDTLPAKYNIVGHSLGGKVCLMVAAKYDIDHVDKVVALDPVDDKPQELTAPIDHPTTNLRNSKATAIYLFEAEKGGQGWFPLAPSDRNATVIQGLYPDQITSLVINPGAGHMAYCDTQTDVASDQTRLAVHETIRKVLR